MITGNRHWNIYKLIIHINKQGIEGNNRTITCCCLNIREVDMFYSLDWQRERPLKLTTPTNNDLLNVINSLRETYRRHCMKTTPCLGTNHTLCAQLMVIKRRQPTSNWYTDLWNYKNLSHIIFSFKRQPYMRQHTLVALFTSINNGGITVVGFETTIALYVCRLLVH